ncbi:MAG: hypothetical protein HFH72_09885 [Lachnospiraceae bacterium]|nr:hypothetical protein [Lachnospiraceae bacterium]
MKKFIKFFLSIIVILNCVSGCGNDVEDANFELEGDVDSQVEVENSDETNGGADSDINVSEYVFDIEGQLDGNAIIRPNCMLLLKSDGTVVGKGDSSFGELGNGERTGCNSWTTVSDLNGVKKIYATIGVGTSNSEIDRKYDFCYALSKDGNLYRWGGNILKPESFLHDVENFICCGMDSDTFLVEYSDGHKDMIISSTISTSIIDITKIIKNCKILYADAYHLVIKEIDSGMTYHVDLEIDSDKEVAIDEKHSIYRSECKEIARCKLGAHINKVGGVCYDRIYVISEKGAVRSFVIKNGSISSKEGWSGRGYKYYDEYDYRNHSVFSLLGGQVETRGENEYGQLGDGTTIDYWDGWISVDEFECVELQTGEGDGGIYCVALDVNHNIWCWGGGFDSTPKIEIAIESNDGDMIGN